MHMLGLLGSHRPPTSCQIQCTGSGHSSHLRRPPLMKFETYVWRVRSHGKHWFVVGDCGFNYSGNSSKHQFVLSSISTPFQRPTAVNKRLFSIVGFSTSNVRHMCIGLHVSFMEGLSCRVGTTRASDFT